jgi:hypothetical protein
MARFNPRTMVISSVFLLLLIFYISIYMRVGRIGQADDGRLKSRMDSVAGRLEALERSLQDGNGDTALKNTLSEYTSLLKEVLRAEVCTT